MSRGQSDRDHVTAEGQDRAIEVGVIAHVIGHEIVIEVDVQGQMIDKVVADATGVIVREVEMTDVAMTTAIVSSVVATATGEEIPTVGQRTMRDSFRTARRHRDSCSSSSS